MKTSIKTIICAIALSVSSVAFATGKGSKSAPKFEANTYVSKDASLHVNVTKLSAGWVTISLKDAKNNEVYSENIAKNDLQYALKMNVNALPDGNYTLEIASASQTITKQINLASERVEVARKVSMQ
jgi:hypothetical protein